MKMLKVALAALVMVAMVTPVIAEDRLSLSGEMRVRGWHKDLDFDGDKDDSTQTWGDQRLRIGGKIAVAEGVSITFRTDITESNWGSDGTAGYGSGRAGSGQQWDRAHIDLAKGNFHLRAGQFLQVYGMNDAVDSQDNGLSMDYLVGPGSLNVFFMVDDDNSSAAVPAYKADLKTGAFVVNPKAAPAQKTGDQSDAFVSGVKFSGKADTLSYDVFVANYNDGAEQDVYVFGLGAKLSLDAINVKAELNVFDGDAADKTATTKAVDAMGTQLLVDASMAASDALTVGGQFFYAAGDDKDAQYTSLGNGFNGWDPINDNGNDLSNEAISYGSPFDLSALVAGGYNSYYGLKKTDAAYASGVGTGVVGGRLYGNFKASDALSFGASAGYFEAEEDKIIDIDAYTLSGGMVYKVMENTSLQLQLQYIDGSLDDGASIDGDFDMFSAGTGLFVKF